MESVPDANVGTRGLVSSLRRLGSPGVLENTFATVGCHLSAYVSCKDDEAYPFSLHRANIVTSLSVSQPAVLCSSPSGVGIRTLVYRSPDTEASKNFGGSRRIPRSPKSTKTTNQIAVMSCEFAFEMTWAVFLVVGSPFGCESWKQGWIRGFRCRTAPLFQPPEGYR